MDGKVVAIRPAKFGDADAIWRILEPVFRSGETYAIEADVSREDAVAYWTANACFVAELDGERLVFTADKEIVLRCGDASITLTKAGKVIIRGSYLLSRSSGVNRIKGGSVQIN